MANRSVDLSKGFPRRCWLAIHPNSIVEGFARGKPPRNRTRECQRLGALIPSLDK